MAGRQREPINKALCSLTLNKVDVINAILIKNFSIVTKVLLKNFSIVT